jgi:hypothetical protein
MKPNGTNSLFLEKFGLKYFKKWFYKIVEKKIRIKNQKLIDSVPKRIRKYSRDNSKEMAGLIK